MNKIQRAEKGIRSYYQQKTEDDELRAWARMEQSNKYFFKYAKARMRYKSPIGPFISETGQVMDDKPCEILNREYFNICVPL